MSRGVEQRDIFLSESDRSTFIGLMATCFKEYETSLFAYCLMGNHFHLLACVGEAPLSLPMQNLLARYSTHFNQTYGRVGHLLQGRYTALLCRDLSYLIHLVAYIHMNPVRAGLVPRVSEWRWSSHREFLDGEPGLLDLGALEDAAGISPAELRARYLERVEDVESSRTGSLEELLADCAGESGITVEELVSGRRGGAFTHAKRLLLRRAGSAGYTDAELAKALRCSQAAIHWLRRQMFK